MLSFVLCPDFKWVFCAVYITGQNLIKLVNFVRHLENGHHVGYFFK